MVTKPDRLARSTTDLLRIVEDLDKRGVGLVMLRVCPGTLLCPA
jgi:DNA invertase Pin-like site-specific DNA recombinase